MGTENPDWLTKFLSSFADTGYKPKEFPGHEGDLQQGRLDIIDSITTDYFVMCDPDDFVNVSVMEKAVDFLEQNEGYAICFARELYWDRFGKITSVQNNRPFSLDRLKCSPMELHNATVFRTSMVKEAVELMGDLKFIRFDWALRLIIANLHPVNKLSEIGGAYRFHDDGCRDLDSEASSQVIGKHETVAALIQHGLI